MLREHAEREDSKDHRYLRYHFLLATCFHSWVPIPIITVFLDYMIAMVIILTIIPVLLGFEEYTELNITTSKCYIKCGITSRTIELSSSWSRSNSKFSFTARTFDFDLNNFCSQGKHTSTSATSQVNWSLIRSSN